MLAPRRLLTSAATAVVGLSVALAALLPVAGAAAADDTLPFSARTVLPPGNSMLYTADGQAAGSLSGDPDDFGANVDDQRELYWGYGFKDGGFHARCDDPQTPRDGVEVCFDDAGVPTIWGETDEDVWFGTGYAIAQIRLFLLDAIVRTARGTLAELTGPAGVPADVQTRVLTYTEDEYEAILAATSQEGRDAVTGYAAGVNAWIDELEAQHPDLVPAEYALLGAEPARITPTDVAAVGVLMTRTVASEGGREMTFVEALRRLEDEFGTEAGRRVFEDFVWREDAGAVTTITPDEGVFPRVDRTDVEADAAFAAMADYAATLPLELADGPGTGAYPVPGSGGLPAFPPPVATSAMLPADLARQAIEQWRAALAGGSWQVSIAPSRTADGSALLISEPQLGYDPTLLVELEVHGGTHGYDARGVSVPGIPTVGIGYSDRVAWSLTTGNSKTIDSFIETTRPDSNDDGAPEYLHDGAWKDMDCRTETVRYRAAPGGVPVPGDLYTAAVDACRTVHGPVVATTADGTLARSVQYAMWMREVETVEGVLRWNRAQGLADFEAAMRRVTWNENTGYADRDGNIAWWHPGLHHVRDPRTDLRLPIPGTGEYDHGGYLAFEDLPHVVNPAKGYVANWNNKPAAGWGMGGSAGAMPGGHGHRVTNLLERLAARDDWTFDALLELDRGAAEEDVRVKEYLAHVLALRGLADLAPRERAALDVLAAWDGSANGPGAAMEFTDLSGAPATVGAAPTIFNTFMEELVAEAFADEPVLADLIGVQSDIGRHVYDMSPVTNLVLRMLDPATSSLAVSRDYLDGRSRDAFVRDVLARTLDRLEGEQADADPATWRSAYRMEAVCSPTGGAIGPCVDMPFLERGTWIHMVGYPAAGTTATMTGVGAGAGANDTALPTTGGGLAAIGSALLAAAGAVRRRRR